MMLLWYKVADFTRSMFIFTQPYCFHKLTAQPAVRSQDAAPIKANGTSQPDTLFLQGPFAVSTHTADPPPWSGFSKSQREEAFSNW